MTQKITEWRPTESSPGIYESLKNRKRDSGFQAIDTRESVDLENPNSSNFNPTSKGFHFRLRSWRKLAAFVVGATLLAVTLLSYGMSPSMERPRRRMPFDNVMAEAVSRIPKIHVRRPLEKWLEPEKYRGLRDIKVLHRNLLLTFDEEHFRIKSKKTVHFQPGKMGIQRHKGKFIGTRITAVEPGSQAADRGVQVNWIMTNIDGKEITDGTKVTQMLDAAKAKAVPFPVVFSTVEEIQTLTYWSTVGGLGKIGISGNYLHEILNASKQYNMPQQYEGKTFTLEVWLEKLEKLENIPELKSLKKTLRDKVDPDKKLSREDLEEIIRVIQRERRHRRSKELRTTRKHIRWIPSTTAPERMVRGHKVKIWGLKKATQYNGLVARLGKCIKGEQEERWEIEIPLWVVPSDIGSRGKKFKKGDTVKIPIQPCYTTSPKNALVQQGTFAGYTQKDQKGTLVKWLKPWNRWKIRIHKLIKVKPENLTIQEEDLPEGWNSAVDLTSGKTYYWQQQWEKPKNRDLPEGWKSAVDPDCGKTYYYNATPQWTKPKTSGLII